MNIVFCSNKSLLHDPDTTLSKKHIKNIAGKGENAGNQRHFLHFTQCFQPDLRQKSPF